MFLLSSSFLCVSEPAHCSAMCQSRELVAAKLKMLGLLQRGPRPHCCKWAVGAFASQRSALVRLCHIVQGLVMPFSRWPTEVTAGRLRVLLRNVTLACVLPSVAGSGSGDRALGERHARVRVAVMHVAHTGQGLFMPAKKILRHTNAVGLGHTGNAVLHSKESTDDAFPAIAGDHLPQRVCNFISRVRSRI